MVKLKRYRCDPPVIFLKKEKQPPIVQKKDFMA